MSASQFDQRYDSIYQRGGEAHEAARAGARPATTSPAFRTAAVEPSADAAAHSTDIAEVIPPGAAPQVQLEGAPDARRKINPYLVALWLLGLALSAFGAWWSVAPYVIEMQATAPTSAFGPPWYFMLSSVAPNVLVAGLVTIAGVLTLHAVGWMRRNG